jgi:hypothetical protein
MEDPDSGPIKAVETMISPIINDEPAVQGAPAVPAV